MSQDWPEGQDRGEEEYIPPPPLRRPAQRPAAPSVPRAAQGSAPPPRYTSNTGTVRRAPQRPPARRDSFPLAVTAVAVLLVLGLGLVFISANGGKSANTNAGGVPAASAPTAPSNDINLLVPTANPQAATAVGSDPPRMKLADFKALYDNPAKRPLIIDVRAKEAYDQGHIVGAESFPEADVDTRYTELPKDKLIIAYCQ